MTRLSIAVVDVLFWPFMQLAVSAAIVKLPSRLFLLDNLLTRPHSFELSMRFYRLLLLPRWKKRLPDGATLVGGRAKRLSPFNPTDLHLFLAETRRSETAHWIQLACVSICWFWNPHWAAIVMTVYAVLSNVPCILAQRYNRAILLRRDNKTNLKQWA